MTDKHTPGPWAVRLEGSRQQEIIVRSTVKIDDPFDGGQIEPTVADLFRGGTGNMADARLIAAAPDLLEALEFVMTAHGEQLDLAFQMAQDALTKARGQPWPDA